MSLLQQYLYRILIKCLFSALFISTTSFSQTQLQHLPKMVTSVNVVYHINQGLDQAKSALTYINNQLDENPSTHIEVVAHASGIHFLLTDATTPQGQPFAPLIESLFNKGVVFKLCERTVHTLNIPREKINKYAVLTPSGVSEITRLQLQGFAYIKP